MHTINWKLASTKAIVLKVGELLYSYMSQNPFSVDIYCILWCFQFLNKFIQSECQKKICDEIGRRVVAHVGSYMYCTLMHIKCILSIGSLVVKLWFCNLVN